MTLFQEPERDGFKHESPIRSFTTWSVEGRYALGKGFRPSMQHLVPYLNAMEEKEHWRLVQILEATSGSPSFLFRQLRSLIQRADPSEGTKFVFRGETPLDINDKIPSIAITLHGADVDKAHWTTAQWTGYFVQLTRALASMRQTDYDAFLAAHKVKSEAEFWKTANVASVLRLIDRLNWWDHYTLKSPITLAQLEKALGRKVSPKEIPQLTIIDETNPVDVLEGIAESMVDGETVKGVDRESFDAAREHVTKPVLRRADPGNVAPSDDPINPNHYGGRECADIGERLSANGYQILKYCWRLGKKDDPCQELDKALWYGESEAALLKRGHRYTAPNVTGIKDPAAFLEDRITHQPQFTQNIARMLWTGYSQRQLQAIIETIKEHRFHSDCGRGLAI